VRHLPPLMHGPVILTAASPANPDEWMAATLTMYRSCTEGLADWQILRVQNLLIADMNDRGHAFDVENPVQYMQDVTEQLRNFVRSFP
jgi:hypothetical protein